MKLSDLFFVLCILTALTACRKSDSGCGQSIDVRIPYEDFGFFPYKGGDSIKLVTSAGPLVTAVCNSEEVIFNGKSNGDSYCPSYYRLEQRRIMDSPFLLNYFMEDYDRKRATYQVHVQEAVFYFQRGDFGSESKYLDSLTIQGRSYDRVRVFTSRNNDTLYYNKAHGILKLIFINRKTWERIP